MLVLADKLLKSLYVDNCVTSVATYEDLRGWECTLEVDNSESGESCRIIHILCMWIIA